MSAIPPNAHQYRIGWISAVQTEYVIACELLDEEFARPQLNSQHDSNAYTFGRIGRHNVVLACLPKGGYGLSPATAVAKDMCRSFPLTFILMVGIGGGAPTKENDIRLGDVVVSSPVGKTGGVIYYDFGATMQNQKFERTGALNAPPFSLLTAIQLLSTMHERRGHNIAECVTSVITKNSRLRAKYQRPDPATDILYDSNFLHADKSQPCAAVCDTVLTRQIQRHPRGPEAIDPAVHYGLIASADKLMKDATVRDELAKNEGVLCFEMEAAGLMNTFPCLVIRGICDYSDSHKNDVWQGYAAAVAAAYAKELLNELPPLQASAIERIPQTHDNDTLLALHGALKPLFSDLAMTISQQRQDVLTMHATMMNTAHASLSSLLQLQSNIPPQVLRHQPVYFLDANNHMAPFYLEFVTSMEVFLFALKQRFSNNGALKIDKHQFAIQDVAKRHDINIFQDWSKCFSPGQEVSMSMIFPDVALKTSCPRCGTEGVGEAETETKCETCGITYQRIELLDDSEPPGVQVAESAKRDFLDRHDRAKGADIHTTNNPSVANRRGRTTPRTASAVFGADDMSEYSRIRLLSPARIKWNKHDGFSPLSISSDGLMVTFTSNIVTCSGDGKGWNVRSNKPFSRDQGQNSFTYFEITVIDGGSMDVICIGLCRLSVTRDLLPGWPPGSVAYHGDDGCVFNGVGTAGTWGPTFGASEVVGCGILPNGNVYFTRGGSYIGTYECGGQLLYPYADVYPTVGMKEKGARIMANFGTSPFWYTPRAATILHEPLYEYPRIDRQQEREMLNHDAPLTEPKQGKWLKSMTVDGKVGMMQPSDYVRDAFIPRGVGSTASRSTTMNDYDPPTTATDPQDPWVEGGRKERPKGNPWSRPMFQPKEVAHSPPGQSTATSPAAVGIHQTYTYASGANASPSRPSTRTTTPIDLRDGYTGRTSTISFIESSVTRAGRPHLAESTAQMPSRMFGAQSILSPQADSEDGESANTWVHPPPAISTSTEPLLSGGDADVLVGKAMAMDQVRRFPPTPIVCKYWLSGSCIRANCRFAHDASGYPCKYWIQGNCLAGEACRFSHDPALLIDFSDQNLQDLTPPNIFEARALRPATDSYGFPQTNSTQSSISNESGRGYPYYAPSFVGSVADRATDYSSAASDTGFESMAASRTLPRRPNQTMGLPLRPAAPQSTMGQFSSKMSKH